MHNAQQFPRIPASCPPGFLGRYTVQPGNVLCVPGLIAYPCCIVLRNLVPVPFGSGAVALINFAPQGGQSVNITATLPQPQTFGNFDIYVGEILIPDIGGFGNQLFPTPQNPPNWSTRIDVPTVAQIAPNSRVVIRPSNSTTGVSGPIIFESIINNTTCRR